MDVLVKQWMVMFMSCYISFSAEIGCCYEVMDGENNNKYVGLLCFNILVDEILIYIGSEYRINYNPIYFNFLYVCAYIEQSKLYFY